MKQIIIALLSIIILILGYNLFRNYKRFHTSEYDYLSKQKIDLNYHDKAIAINYYQAIEDLNRYVKFSWAINDVDVKNPDNDDENTKTLVNEYTKKLGIVKFYEARLINSANMKSEGLSDKDVIMFETSGSKIKEYDDFIKKKFLMESFLNNPEKYNLKIGDSNLFIYEVQRYLLKKGYKVILDGIFRDLTFDAIKKFEQDNGLFSDGKMDLITLNYLLR